jgi:hypothetical protein
VFLECGPQTFKISANHEKGCFERMYSFSRVAQVCKQTRAGYNNVSEQSTEIYSGSGPSSVRGGSIVADCIGYHASMQVTADASAVIGAWEDHVLGQIRSMDVVCSANTTLLGRQRNQRHASRI